MVVDSSAVVAMLLGESEELSFLRKMHRAQELYISPVSVLEISTVLMRSSDPALDAKLDNFLARARVRLVPTDGRQAAIAREAYRQYGKGRGHKAGLNLGDCFSYALAIALNDRLLFKGNDFIHTDVKQA